MAALLGLEPDLQVVAEADSGEEAIERAIEARPDVVLMDVEMPGVGGIEATARLRRRLPETRVLIVITFGRPGYLRRGMQAGANGFVVNQGWLSRAVVVAEPGRVRLG